MDLTSVLIPLGASRRQLRRFVAALEISEDCDDCGSLEQVLEIYSRDAARVKRHIKECFATQNIKLSSKKGKKQDNVVAKNAGLTDLQDILESAFEEWNTEGAPKRDIDTVHRVSDASTILVPSQETHSTSNMSRHACIECHQPTPYIFAPLNLRLCQICEQRNPQRYQLLTVDLAQQMYALGGEQLHRLKLWQNKNAGSRVDSKHLMALKTDVEALVAQMGANEISDRKHSQSAKEWRENTYRTDHKGKTHKWKEWNSGTFQRKRQMCKEGYHEDVSTVTNMFEMSGLEFVGY